MLKLVPQNGIGRCAATDVVRSTASSLEITPERVFAERANEVICRSAVVQ
jgi:hypothetical protein